MEENNGHEHFEHGEEPEIPETQHILARYEEIRDAKPVRNGSFVGEEKESFYVMLNEEEVYELSPLAYYVWALCDGETTVEAIVDRIVEEAGVPKEEAIPPLVLALEQLRDADLVRY
mgnify:CR=1 FL=1